MFGVIRLKGYVDLRFWEEADLAHFYETEDKISLIQEEWVRGLGVAANFGESLFKIYEYGC